MTARREDRRSKPARRVSEQEVELERLRAEVAAWRARAAALPVRADAVLTSASGRNVEATYTALDLPSDVIAATGLPGNFPYTRGIHPTMYRGRLWTMRQFAGFGTAEDTNARYKFLLERGQTGLSVAFDFPTLMGYDSDHPRSEGEVGKCGVAVSSLAATRRGGCRFRSSGTSRSRSRPRRRPMPARRASSTWKRCSRGFLSIRSPPR